MELAENIILVFEIQVDGRGRVFDFLSNISDRSIFEPLFHKQFFGRLQDLTPQLFLLALFPRANSHFLRLDNLLNDVKLIIVSDFSKNIK